MVKRDPESLLPLTAAMFHVLVALADGLIRESIGSAKDDERRRSYALTAFGRDVARAEAARLEHTLALARSKALFKHT